MILRSTYCGLVITNAVVESTNGGKPDRAGQTIWPQVTGVVADAAATRRVVGQEISWPYRPEDWEEVTL